LDTGALVFQSRLPLGKDAALYKLRSINTEVCVNLTLLALQSLGETGWLPSREQAHFGRYYSFMPAILKEDCLNKFNKHITVL
jgi:hypothetical protein